MTNLPSWLLHTYLAYVHAYCFKKASICRVVIPPITPLIPELSFNLYTSLGPIGSMQFLKLQILITTSHCEESTMKPKKDVYSVNDVHEFSIKQFMSKGTKFRFFFLQNHKKIQIQIPTRNGQLMKTIYTSCSLAMNNKGNLSAVHFTKSDLQ